MNWLLTQKERQALKRVITMLEIDRTSFIWSIIFGSVGLGCSIALSATAAWLIARAAQMPPVLTLSVAATAVRTFGIGRALMRYLQRLASHRVALRGMDSLRQNVYDHLAQTPVNRVVSLRRGDILARTGADVDDVGDFVVKSLLPTVVCIIVGVGTVLGIGLISPAASLILAFFLLVSGVITPLMTFHAYRRSEEESRRARTELTAAIMSDMDGAAELQLSGGITSLRAHINTVEDQFTHSRVSLGRTAGIASGMDRLAMGLAVVGALLVGIPETLGGQIAAVLLAVLALTPLAAFEGTADMGPAAAQLMRSTSAAVRIVDLLGNDQPVKTHAIPASHETPVLKAEHLAIGWPGGPTVAEDLNLELTPGRRIALVGPSGIGKTTLLDTLSGMLEPRAGEATLNGTPVWAGDRRDVTQVVTMTAEDAHIFATTVLENIRVSNPATTPEEATALLERVGLSAWLNALPAGLETLIGSGGTTVSGGERRRLLLARALASPSPLLLLDEPGEHLDPATADALMRTLLSADPQRGVLVVTHRLSALELADTVMVLDHPGFGQPAQVVASGTHQELAASMKDYQWALEQETL